VGASNSSNLGDLRVNFGAEGDDKLQKKMKDLQSAFDKTAAKSSSMSNVIGGAMSLAGGGVGAVAGMAAKGVSGSSEMERINVLLDRMSKILAGAFAPALDALDRVLSSAEPLVKKFATNIGMMVEFWAGAFEKLMMAVSPLLDKVMELQGVIYDLLLSAFDELVDFLMQGVDVAVNLLVKALQWLIDVAKQFFDMVGAHHHQSGARTLGKAGGGFEDVGAIYKRIQTAALRTGGGGKTQEQLLADIARQTKAGENFQNFMNGMTKIGESIQGVIQWMKDKWPFGK